MNTPAHMLSAAALALATALPSQEEKAASLQGEGGRPFVASASAAAESM